jgi:hypothetical protein
MSFKCFQCGIEYLAPNYNILLERSRSEFYAGDRCPEVAISISDADLGFCSAACSNIGRDKLIIRGKFKATHPQIGPIEIYSCCGGPVDMTKYHYCYVESIDDVKWKNGDVLGVSEHDIDYLAVFLHKM